MTTPDQPAAKLPNEAWSWLPRGLYLYWPSRSATADWACRGAAGLTTASPGRPCCSFCGIHYTGAHRCEAAAGEIARLKLEVHHAEARGIERAAETLCVLCRDPSLRLVYRDGIYWHASRVAGGLTEVTCHASHIRALRPDGAP